MKVNVTLTLEVGDNPTADAISYFIEQTGYAEADDHYSPEEWVERCVLDVVECDLFDHDMTNGACTWSVVGSHSELQR